MLNLHTDHVVRTLSLVSGTVGPQSGTDPSHQLPLQPTTGPQAGASWTLTQHWPKLGGAEREVLATAPQRPQPQTLHTIPQDPPSHPARPVLPLYHFTDEETEAREGLLAPRSPQCGQGTDLGLTLESALQTWCWQSSPRGTLPRLGRSPQKGEKSGGTAQAMQTVPAWERGFGDRAPRGAPPAPLPEQLPLTSAFP